MTPSEAHGAPSLHAGRLTRAEAALWTAAALAVVLLHGAIAYAVQAAQPEEEAGGAPPALMIELAPMVMAPPIPTESVISEDVPTEQAETVEDVEEVAETEPEQAERPPEPVVETAVETDTVARIEADEVAEEDVAALTPEKQVETLEKLEPQELVRPDASTIEPVDVQEAEPEEAVEPEVVEETLPEVEAETPEVAVPIPTARPRIEKPVRVAEDEPEKPKARKPATETRKAEKKPAKPASRSGSVAKVDAPPAPKAAAPRKNAGVSASKVSPARWHSKVLSWLNRHKRYPSAAKSKRQEGTVQVAFTVDANGRVTSSRIARSSGNPVLDKAALDMVRRSSPVPAPPAEMAQSRISLAVPVDFSLR